MVLELCWVSLHCYVHPFTTAFCFNLFHRRLLLKTHSKHLNKTWVSHKWVSIIVCSVQTQWGTTNYCYFLFTAANSIHWTEFDVWKQKERLINNKLRGWLLLGFVMTTDDDYLTSLFVTKLACCHFPLPHHIVLDTEIFG